LLSGEADMRRYLLATALLMATASAFAQTPYAGMHLRAVKALSDQQIADLAAGRGMGLALAGELNGYPGPAHVIELADRLALSQDQRERIQRLFDSMKAEAVPLGSNLIALEAELERLFASRSVTTASLKAATAAIAATQGELRETHLEYHILAAEILGDDQMQKYAVMRGYTWQNADQTHHH
jgi:hypothetical protein